MKTTLKRGVGRGAHLNGNGNAVYPPGAVSAVTRYEQPPRRPRSGLGTLGRGVVLFLLVLISLALGAAGGLYLYFHQSVSALHAHSADVKVAQKQLDVPLPGHAAIALVLGYDHRVGADARLVGNTSRSDTMMLIRADPSTKTISMLSFPRDLIVPIYCKSGFVTDDRINSAYSRCGATGSLETVKHLTGLPVNYLITVNFHGFKQIVDDLGGVWLDIDRRYYNKNVGTSDTNFANINLQPGYQLLTGGSALEFVRYRHTDSDLYRLARQQQFVRAMKQQIAHNFDPLNLPKIVSAITKNVEVGSKVGFSDKTVLSYALFGATLPGGHFFQVKISDVTGYAELSAPASSIQSAVQQFVNPDITVAKAANATALGQKLKPPKNAAPAPKDTTITVLNGNGVAGSAANASYLLAQRGYATVLPPNGLQPNAPTQNYFHSAILFDPAQKGAKPAAEALAKLIAPADVKPLPADPALRALDPGSMIVLVTGETFHNTLSAPAAAPVASQVTPHQAANVRYDAASTMTYLRPLLAKIPFEVEEPTVLERSSYPDTLPSDVPARVYPIANGKTGLRLVYHTAGNEFWGIEETNFTSAPVLADRSFQHNLGGREFQLYYNGAHLHMIVLNANGASYWVVNTLLDSLSNETMIAIAKGLKPVGAK